MPPGDARWRVSRRRKKKLKTLSIFVYLTYIRFKVQGGTQPHWGCTVRKLSGAGIEAGRLSASDAVTHRHLREGEEGEGRTECLARPLGPCSRVTEARAQRWPKSFVVDASSRKSGRA